MNGGAILTQRRRGVNSLRSSALLAVTERA